MEIFQGTSRTLHLNYHERNFHLNSQNISSRRRGYLCAIVIRFYVIERNYISVIFSKDCYEGPYLDPI